MFLRIKLRAAFRSVLSNDHIQLKNVVFDISKKDFMANCETPARYRRLLYQARFKCIWRTNKVEVIDFAGIHRKDQEIINTFDHESVKMGACAATPEHSSLEIRYDKISTFAKCPQVFRYVEALIATR